ncbi:MAG: RNA helicase, partial [Methylotenera sp.]|nr:RNA helicase [Methylotenera sp.]
GAAVSLVDREELKLLKDIEKLIKREIPKVHVEGFTPNANPEPEAPRSTQPHGRPPRGHGQGQQRKAHTASSTEGNAVNPNAGRNQNRGNGQRNGQSRNQTTQINEGRPAQGNTQKPAQNINTKNMSEAARHQAMPQPALFVPPSPSRHQPNRQNTTRPNESRGNAGRTNTNPNSTHRSGGRGR